MKNKTIFHILAVLLWFLFANPVVGEQLFAALHDLGDHHQQEHSNERHHTEHHPGHDLPNSSGHEPHNCESSHDAVLPSIISVSSIKEVKVVPQYASLGFTDIITSWTASEFIIFESTRAPSLRHVGTAQTRAPPIFL